MFNYLKKHNMRNSLKTLLCLTVICVFSNNAAAKICFLPDGNCGKTKININSGENGCIYKDKDAAETGMSKCEIAFQRNSCWWRRCNSDNKTIFDKLADCQKKIEDATSQKCQACGSCYKLVPIQIPQNACPDGYSTKYQSQNDCPDGKTFSENGTYNGSVCGACTKTETCPSGYSTQYQSLNDCKSGETFSSNGSVGNLICGKCEKTTLITINIKDKATLRFVGTAMNSDGLEGNKNTETTTSFTKDVSDGSKHIVKLKFIKNKYTEYFILNRNNEESTVTLSEGDSATTFSYWTNEKLAAEENYTTAIVTSCVLTLNIDGKDIDSFTYGDYVNCSDIVNKYSNPDSIVYNKEYQYDDYKVVFNKVGDILPAKDCSYYGLKKRSDCKTGEIFLADTRIPTDDYCNECGVCTTRPIMNPTITITYNDARYLTRSCPDSLNSRYSCYYNTLKFKASSSDGKKRTVKFLTHPGSTCTLVNQVSNYVTTDADGKSIYGVFIDENEQTTYLSQCGSATSPLYVPHLGDIHTYIDGIEEDVIPIDTEITSNTGFFDISLNGRITTTDNYIIKYKSESSLTPDLNPGDSTTCNPGKAYIEYARYYYYLPTKTDSLTKPDFNMIAYGENLNPIPTLTYINKSSNVKLDDETGKLFTDQITILPVKQDVSGNRNDSVTYTYSMDFGDYATSSGDISIPDSNPNNSPWSCGSMLMSKENYTKATGKTSGTVLVGNNAAGNAMYYGDDTFGNIRLTNSITCPGEYVLVFGCKK